MLDQFRGRGTRAELVQYCTQGMNTVHTIPSILEEEVTVSQVT